MASYTKVTFTLDRATVDRLEDAASRLSLPKSGVVREAIAEYHGRIGRLSESERLKMLRTLDELLARIPNRPQSEVDRELKAIRQARRSGGRRSLRRGNL
jgi:predicted transcriptional regulator